jgi:hypothetical protein
MSKHDLELEKNVNQQFDQIVRISQSEYLNISNWLHLKSLVETNLPILIVENIGEEVISALSKTVSLNNENKVVSLTLDYLKISKKIIMESLRREGYEYTKSLVIAAVAHELYHVYQFINKKNVDEYGNINDDGELEARMFSLIALKTYLDNGVVLDFSATQKLMSEIWMDI